MIKLAICDDNEQDLSRTVGLLEQYKKTRGLDYLCKCFQSGVDLLEEVKTEKYHLILLDVLMPGLSGMQIAKEIRLIDQNVKLLFLSSSPQFAAESYAVGAFHYLIKPAGAEQLFPLLDRALTEALHQDDTGLAIKSRTGFIHVPFSRLEYVEVMSRTVGFHLTDGSVIETFGTLSTYESQLAARPEFLKVHRSYLINLFHVESMDRKSITTRLSHQIPIARALCAQVKDDYMKFLFSSKHPSLSSFETAVSPLPLAAPSSNRETASPQPADNGAYRILLVDDEPSECTRWASILRKKGCEVQCANGGAQAQQLAAQGRFDCVVLDVLLSGENGFSLCAALHEKTGAPIVFLSCLTDSDNQIRGFTSGGVDFITKDTSADLFWIKVEARIRLFRKGRTLLCFEPLILDQAQRRATINGAEVFFTPTEFDLLWLLAEHAGQIYSTDTIYHTIWDDHSWNDDQTVQVHMSRLRRKLEKSYPHHYFIDTVWGEGYRFMPIEETVLA